MPQMTKLDRSLRKANLKGNGYISVLTYLYYTYH